MRRPTPPGRWACAMASPKRTPDEVPPGVFARETTNQESPLDGKRAPPKGESSPFIPPKPAPFWTFQTPPIRFIFSLLVVSDRPSMLKVVLTGTVASSPSILGSPTSKRIISDRRFIKSTAWGFCCILAFILLAKSSAVGYSLVSISEVSYRAFQSIWVRAVRYFCACAWISPDTAGEAVAAKDACARAPPERA